jgi:hypothetical protein
VSLKSDGTLKAFNVDVAEVEGCRCFIYKGKRFPPGVYFLVRTGGRKVLVSKKTFARFFGKSVGAEVSEEDEFKKVAEKYRGQVVYFVELWRREFNDDVAKTKRFVNWCVKIGLCDVFADVIHVKPPSEDEIRRAYDYLKKVGGMRHNDIIEMFGGHVASELYHRGLMNVELRNDVGLYAVPAQHRRISRTTEEFLPTLRDPTSNDGKN